MRGLPSKREAKDHRVAMPRLICGRCAQIGAKREQIWGTSLRGIIVREREVPGREMEVGVSLAQSILRGTQEYRERLQSIQSRWVGIEVLQAGGPNFLYLFSYPDTP